MRMFNIDFEYQDYDLARNYSYYIIDINDIREIFERIETRACEIGSEGFSRQSSSHHYVAP